MRPFPRFTNRRGHVGSIGAPPEWHRRHLDSNENRTTLNESSDFLPGYIKPCRILWYSFAGLPLRQSPSEIVQKWQILRPDPLHSHGLLWVLFMAASSRRCPIMQKTPYMRGGPVSLPDGMLVTLVLLTAPPYPQGFPSLHQLRPLASAAASSSGHATCSV
jgi:hypothetical protein